MHKNTYAPHSWWGLSATIVVLLNYIELLTKLWGPTIIQTIKCWGVQGFHGLKCRELPDAIEVSSQFCDIIHKNYKKELSLSLNPSMVCWPRRQIRSLLQKVVYWRATELLCNTDWQHAIQTTKDLLYNVGQRRTAWT